MNIQDLINYFMNIYKLLFTLIFIAHLSIQAEAQHPPKDAFIVVRERMVKLDMEERGISDKKVLETFLKVPREFFVLSSWTKQAYQDSPLPIGEGQTISQPYVVALMTEALKLKEGDKVLEIGTGSGYQAAILAELKTKVYSIEIRKKLTEFAKANLSRSGYKGVQLKTADGYDGWKEHAPFDAIMITCAVNHVPSPLKEQLKIGGRLILPLGSTLYFQSLILITRKDKTVFSSQLLGDVSFVPMIGKALQPKDNIQQKNKK